MISSWNLNGSWHKMWPFHLIHVQLILKMKNDWYPSYVFLEKGSLPFPGIDREKIKRKFGTHDDGRDGKLKLECPRNGEGSKGLVIWKD